jgi:allantoin racemase
MMRILVVNPNTTAQMTEAIRLTAMAAAGDQATIDALQPANGPASIEGQFDEVVSAFWTLDAVLNVADSYDGIVIACYSAHPVIGALREALCQPVIGIMEASIIHALLLGHRFSIVTTSARWQPLLQEGVRLLGFESRCASIRSSGMAVLDLERLPPSQVRQRLVDEARMAVEHDGAEVICLGCAGMTELQNEIASALPVPVVDGVRAAIQQLLGLGASSLTTSKTGLYQPIEIRQLSNLPAGIASTYATGGRRSPRRQPV